MPRDRLGDTAKLRKRFHPAIEIMLDESLRKPSDVELFAQMEVADIVNFHPSKLGCLSITRETILKTQEEGIKANIGSALMTDIGLFHYLSLASSIPRLDYPLEEVGLSNFYGYSILSTPPKITEGYASLQDINVASLDFYVAKKFKIEKRVFFKEQVAHVVKKLLDTVM
jgi:L-alanine-DL-glutamate epimerase-like enolase superfamily enzyme